MRQNSMRFFDVIFLERRDYPAVRPIVISIKLSQMFDCLHIRFEFRLQAAKPPRFAGGSGTLKRGL